MTTRTLLCVEPDAASADFIRSALLPYGFEIKNITSGDQAIDWGKKNAPVLILVSVEPRKVGYAICNKIKRSSELKAVPLILISSEETHQTFEQHKKLKARADEYMLKPIDKNELLENVGKLIGLGEMQPIGPGQTSEEMIISTGDEEEISIGDGDIVEEELSGDSTGPINGAGAKDLDLDSIFDRETEDAFDAIQNRKDITGPLLAPPLATEGTPAPATASQPPPPSPWSDEVEAWADESTRSMTVSPVFDFTFPRTDAQDVDDRTRRIDTPPLQATPTDVPPMPDDVLASSSSHDVSVPMIVSPALVESRIVELETRAHELETDNHRLAREIDELRGRLQSQPLMKEKDLLNLREVINRKEKDVLDLRDALDAKERQILDHKDRNREHDRARRDLEEKMLGLEKNLVSASERITALSQDKERALDREKGLKARLDHAQAEIQKAHDEADMLKKRLTSNEDRARGELEKVRGDLEARIAELEETHRQETTRSNEERAAAEASAEAEHKAEVDRIKSTHATELEAIQRRASDELIGQGDRLQGEINKLRREHDKALAALKEEQTLQLAAEREAHQASIEAKERDHKNEILGLRRRQEEELGGAEDRRQKELAELEARRVAELEGAEMRRRAELQTRDEEHHGLIAEMDRRHFTENTELSERHRSEMDQAHGRAARAEGELAARTEELAETQRRLSARDADMDALRADVREREVKLGQARDRAAELEARVADFEDQILRAYQKLRNDEKVVDKAKRALAVALALLDGSPAAPQAQQQPTAERAHNVSGTPATGAHAATPEETTT